MKYFQRKVSRCDGLYGIASCRAVPVNRVSNRHRVKPPDDLPRFALEQTRLQDPPSRQESKEACLVQSVIRSNLRRSTDGSCGREIPGGSAGRGAPTRQHQTGRHAEGARSWSTTGFQGGGSRNKVKRQREIR